MIRARNTELAVGWGRGGGVLLQMALCYMIPSSALLCDGACCVTRIFQPFSRCLGVQQTILYGINTGSTTTTNSSMV